MPRSQGEGFYSSLTRHGSEKDEQRYRDLEEKGAVLEEHRAETAPARPEAVHDATGKRRRGLRPIVIVLVILALLVGAAMVWDVLHHRDVLPAPPWAEWVDEVLPRGVPEVPDLPTPELPDVTPSPTEPSTPPTIDPVSLRPPAERLAPTTGRAPNPNPSIDAAAETPRLTTESTQRTLDWAELNAITRAEAQHAAHATAPGPNQLPALDPFFDFTTTASGLRYRVERKAFGPKAQVRDYVVVRYTVTHAYTGVELDATPPGEPLGFVVWSGAVFRGLDEGVAGMRVGERRTLIVPADLAIAPDQLAPPQDAVGDVPGDDALPPVTLKVDLELLNVLPGVRKRVLTPGTGNFAGPGDTVRLHWSLYASQGHSAADAVIDSRRFGGPVTLVLGAGDVIPGIELGVAGMAEGETADLYIPPYLAYGKEGAAGGLVPPHAAVRCRVELLDVVER